MENNKIFDEYHVDCNDCLEYWTERCDGPSEGLERPCKSFKAIRRVDIPLQINALKSALKSLEVAVVFLAVCQIIQAACFIYHIVGGY